MASTGTRLRKTFQYPSDSESSDVSRDELDEEEQEQVVSTIQQQNTHQNAIYTNILTVLPVLFALSFVIIIPTFPLFSTLGVVSLLISSGRMRFSATPPPPRPQSGRSSVIDAIPKWSQLTYLEHRLLDAVPEKGPLRVALPWLNVAICAVLSVAAAMLYRRASAGNASEDVEVTWLFCLLPGVAWVMIEVAMRSMGEVDKGVGELERLRYRYKGA